MEKTGDAACGRKGERSAVKPAITAPRYFRNKLIGRFASIMYISTFGRSCIRFRTIPHYIADPGPCISPSPTTRSSISSAPFTCGFWKHKTDELMDETDAVQRPRGRLEQEQERLNRSRETGSLKGD